MGIWGGAMQKPNFHELAKMVKQDSAASQDHLAESIAELLAGQGDTLSDREKALMAGMLRQLLAEVELSIRSKLAEKLSVLRDVPAELIEYLANEEIDVARPVLLNSELLNDEMLLEIIRHRTLEHQLAIAMRKSVSEQISGALVEQGHERVIVKLLENQNAEISKRTMSYLVEQSRRVDSYQNPIIERRDLPSELAERMYGWISDQLRQRVVERFSLDRALLDQALALSREESKEHGAETTGAAAALVDAVGDDDGIRPAQVIEFLRDGEIPLFEEAFARMTGVESKLVRRLIYEPGGEGIAIACKACVIAKADFASIFILSRQARPGDQSVRQGEVRRVLDLYDRLEPSAAKALFSSWQRNPEYTALQNGISAALTNAA